jgi:hypothetical protein
MMNGYCMPCGSNSIAELSNRIESDSALAARLLDALRVGVHWSTQVGSGVLLCVAGIVHSHAAEGLASVCYSSPERSLSGSSRADYFVNISFLFNAMMMFLSGDAGCGSRVGSTSQHSRLRLSDFAWWRRFW